MSLLLLFVLALSGCQTQMDAQQTSVSKIQASLKSPVIKQTPTPAFAAYVLVGSGQAVCYDNKNVVACPVESSAFYGQDAQFTRNRPAYRDNGDGTVSDLVTGLMWQQDPGIKMSYDQAVAGAASFDLAGYHDWRLPNIKELYSLILFDGTDVSACKGSCTATPFIDTR